MTAEMLAHGLQELEWSGDTSSKGKRVVVSVTRYPLQLCMTVASEDMGCEMVYPAEALMVCNVRQELKFEYRFSLLHMSLRSLQQADEVCLQLDSEGLLDLKVKHPNSQFVQFFVQPLIDEEEDLFESTAAE